MELYSDKYYIQRVLEGDTNSFACLLDKYSNSVFSLIHKMVHNREDAEELTQDVFIKAFKSLSSFKGESTFSTWIYRIAYNTTISATRKRKREYTTIEEMALENVGEDEVAQMLGEESNEEQLNRLENALKLLPPEEQAIILLFYKEEKQIDEIAEIVNLKVSNIKVKLHRIRKKMFVLMRKMESE
ncbi:MAG: RNA polymerase sigma factor [Phocaeicola sp.]